MNCLRLVKISWTLVQQIIEMLWWVCRGGGCTHAKNSKNTHVFVVSIRVHRLIFKHSANIGRLVGFITVYSNCDGSLKWCCYGNRFVARVGENWHTLSSFCVLCWHSTTVGKIATRMRDYFTPGEPTTSCEYFVNSGPVTSEIFRCVCRIGWMNAHVAKLCCAMVFKCQLLGGSSIASM